MKKNTQGVYWLTIVDHASGRLTLEAEAGYKPCKRPGRYHAVMSPYGGICPGCDRMCRIPAAAAVIKGDEIIVRGRAK